VYFLRTARLEIVGNPQKLTAQLPYEKIGRCENPLAKEEL